MEYSCAVRHRFEHPSAVAGTDDSNGTVTASAEDRSLNVWIRFEVAVADGAIARVAYNVFGCPHLIAACDWAAEWLRGRDRAALRQLPLERLARETDLPREKFGKLLRLEDALTACAGRLEQRLGTNGGEG
jgi:NifU-like protein involved in Fe-S cluster formation